MKESNREMKFLHSSREAKEYWSNLFDENFDRISFYKDYKSKYNNCNLKSMNFTIMGNSYLKLNTLTRNNDLSLYITLLSILNVQLYQYTLQNKISIGIPGYYKNNQDKRTNPLLPLIVNLSSTMKFNEVLINVKDLLVKTYKYQNYPITELVKERGINSLETQLPVCAVIKGLHQDLDIQFIMNKEECEIVYSIEKIKDTLEFEIFYDSNKFMDETIEGLLHNFSLLLDQILSNTEISLSDLKFLNDIDVKNIVENFNSTSTEYPRNKTICKLFEEVVEKFPNKTAVVYNETAINYTELNEKANQLARTLRENSMENDGIIGIVAESSIEMIIGVIGILKAGRAYLPIDPNYPEERIRYMIEECKVKCLLVQDVSQEMKLNEVKYINLNDDKTYNQVTDNLEDIGDGNSLAYVIYTSGSTGRPKGVMVENRNVVRLVKNTNYIHFKQDDRILQTGALVFDASTFEIWGALLNGLELYLLDKNTIIDAKKMENEIRKNNISILWLTSSLFNKLSEERIEIFQSLRYLLYGGEVISVKHSNRVREMCNNLIMINGYGPTENTTFSTYFEVNNTYNNNIPIGKPIANSTAYIVDNNQRLQPIGACGELWVGGDGVARGYLNNPQLTYEKFIENPFKSGERLYKTGDIARWRPDGNIEFIGRKDNQVKIRGFRIELDEIENMLNAIKGIKEVTVLPREKENRKFLCAYFVSQKKYSASELRERLKRNLPDYMIPVHFITLDKMPLNRNGKIDKKKLLEVELDITTGTNYVPPSNCIEYKLSDIWRDILGIDKISIEDNFFELGGHSLAATILESKIYKEFHIEIPLGEIFRLDTIKKLENYISSNNRGTYIEIKKVEEKEYYEVSSAQKRMYMMQATHPESTVYNIPGAFIIEGKLDIEKVENTMKSLIERHESLRTSFRMYNGSIVQKIHPLKEINFEIEKIVIDKEDEIDDKISSFVRPFDMENGPLLRMAILRIREERNLLLFDLHHIIADGISMSIMTKEFSELYSGKELTPLSIQYKDYSEWQKRLRETEKFNDERLYWINQFKDEVQVLNMPTDYVRPSIQSFSGDAITFILDSDMTMKLRKITKETGTTMYMILLAAVNVLLSKYSGQEDIVIGSDIAGRSHADLENVMGMFVNTLVMRNNPAGNKSFDVFLKEIKKNALKAYENQDYQFEELVEELELDGDNSRNPLFNIMFAMMNIELDKMDIGGLKFSDYPIKNNKAPLDMTFVANEVENEIYFNVCYCNELFKRETIIKMWEHLENILKDIVKDIKVKLSDIIMLSKEEVNNILFKFNDNKRIYDKDKIVPILFQEQAKKTPDKVAVIFGDEKYTYRQLDEKSNMIAQALTNKGIRREALVGILFERSIDMLASILGVFKAGGAYIPIDTNYPENRIKQIFSDSQAEFLITKSMYIKDKKRFYSEMAYDTGLVNIIYLDNLNSLINDNNIWNTLRKAKKIENMEYKITDSLGRLYYENSEVSENEYRMKVSSIYSFIINNKLCNNGKIGIILENPINRIIANLVVQNTEIEFVNIDYRITVNDKQKIIENNQIELLITDNYNLDEIDGLLWLIPSLKSYILLEEYDDNQSIKEKDFRILWNIVADETTEQINDYGWQNSYDGERFSIEEMNEYIDNFKVKLEPYLNSNSRVFDIGCGHGLALFELAPSVKEYLATDLSESIIEKNRIRACREKLDNIKLEIAAASEIHKIGATNYNVVICCSVIHYFPNTLYLENIIKNSIDILGDQGIIYLDDLLDLEKKQELIYSVQEYKKKHPLARSKSEWDNDLFVNRDFFRFIQSKYPQIVKVEITNKMGKIKNELTKFRYDVIITVNKKSKVSLNESFKEKNRYMLKDILGSYDSVLYNTKLEDTKVQNNMEQGGYICDKSFIDKCSKKPVNYIYESSDLCYVIYTSGSSGKPKGAMVEHCGMLNHLYSKINDLHLSDNSIVVQNASHCFDISVWQFLSALIVGGTTVIYDNETAMDPKELSRRIIEDKVSILEVVPSFLEVLIDQLERNNTLLTELKYLLVTGEEVKSKLVKKWFEIYKSIKVVNAYGPTEASDDITHHIMDSYIDCAVVPIGKPIQNLNIYIVDEYMKLCPVGIVGEIVVSGIGVGRGYLNNLEKTKKAFTYNPFIKDKNIRLYRTGDLGRWLPDGTIEFLCRKDYQVKIRGFRIELGEVENRLLQCNGVRSCLVVDVEDNKGNKELCAYVVSDKILNIDVVKAELGDTLPEYMVPNYFVIMDKMPLTTNGKIDRKSLPKPKENIYTDYNYEEPKNEIQEILVNIWREVLGVDKISINDDFFKIGGHSLKATMVVSKIYKELQIEIQLKEFFSMPIIKDLSEYLKTKQRSKYIKIKPAEKKEYYEASSSQKRIYTLKQIDLDSTGYNMPISIVIKGNLVIEKVENAFKELIRRHESLRTSFENFGDQILQKINNEIDFKVEHEKVTDKELDSKIEKFVKPFDLKNAPLIRVGILELEEQKYVLMLDMHHIISDGVSMGILINEFAEIYKGNKLEELEIQYKDFAEWQNEYLKSDKMKEQKKYWQDVFKGELPILNMPTDYPRPEVLSFEGDELGLKLDRELACNLEELASETSTTMYMVLLSAANILFSKYTGQEDVIIGSPVAGRPYDGLEKIIGMFINTLAMRNYPNGDKKYIDFLNEVRENALGAFENQDYQFNDLVDILNVKRDASRNPIFDVIVAMQNAQEADIEVNGLDFNMYNQEYKISKMDITILAGQEENETYIYFQYSTNLFKKKTIEKLLEDYIEILKQITKDRNIKLQEINISCNVTFIEKVNVDSDFDF